MNEFWSVAFRDEDHESSPEAHEAPGLWRTEEAAKAWAEDEVAEWNAPEDTLRWEYNPLAHSWQGFLNEEFWLMVYRLQVKG